MFSQTKNNYLPPTLYALACI